MAGSIEVLEDGRIRLSIYCIGPVDKVQAIAGAADSFRAEDKASIL